MPPPLCEGNYFYQGAHCIRMFMHVWKNTCLRPRTLQMHNVWRGGMGYKRHQGGLWLRLQTLGSSLYLLFYVDYDMSWE